MKLKRIIIAGGGTGGHIFPAIAVAKALQRINPTIEILFIGAKGKMEMEKVPQAGFSIEGLDITGFNRSKIWKNWSLPFKLIRSFIQVKNIFRAFDPDAVFGVGGYSSFPVLKYAQRKGIPSFLHESNSIAGKSNIMLGKKADLVMVAQTELNKYFPQEKIFISGNPIRSEIAHSTVLREEAMEFFGLKKDKLTILVVGGSLGAKSINTAFTKGIDKILNANLQLIWQTGKGSLGIIDESLRSKKEVFISEFIHKMNYAYVAADIVVSRAGAIALAEICAMKKPSILVPFPFAAEDHQTGNALELVSNHAALMITDKEVEEKLVDTAIELIHDKSKCEVFSKAAGSLFIEDADMLIALKIIEKLNAKND